MSMATSTSDHDVAISDAFSSLLASVGTRNASPAAAVSDAAGIQLLEERLEGPDGVVRFLLRRMWRPCAAASANSEAVARHAAADGDGALSVLVHLVESRPIAYMALAASSVRRDIERRCAVPSAADDAASEEFVGGALLAALAKLLVVPRGEGQVGIATDAAASLLAMCRWDRGRRHGPRGGTMAARVLATTNALWQHLRRQTGQERRASSCAQMRIAALMVDICLLGGEEMSLALSSEGENPDGSEASECIMDKLLHVALDHPNDDPLLQMSAIDQLERLTVDDSTSPVTSERAEFLLTHDILRRGLLRLVGSPGEVSLEYAEEEEKLREAEWGEVCPINGGAALRLLTEICRVGVASSGTTSEIPGRDNVQLLLSSFREALRNFHPRGEVELLSYVHAVSSLVASCAVVASSSASSATVQAANTVLSDATLLQEWLSLHSRASQPLLKSTVLVSLSQVMEPATWKDEWVEAREEAARPSDAVVLRLYRAFGRANRGRDPTGLVLAAARSPFLEERLGAYSLLRALASRGVCVRALLLYTDGSGDGDSGGDGGGFLDWFLNPDLDATAEGKRAKYRIVEAMLSKNSDFLGGLLPGRALRRLEEWRRQGPNYATSVSRDMATE